jgi:site-specific recombinase XerD
MVVGEPSPTTSSTSFAPHDIRHTVGAILATNSVSLEIIAKVLDHKSLATTARYAHLMPSVISHAAKVLAAAIPKPPESVAEAS